MLIRSDTFAMLSVCNSIGLLILLKLCPALGFLEQLVTKGLQGIYTFTCSPKFSYDVVASAPRQSMYLLIVDSDHCVKDFAYALQMRCQNLIPHFCVCAKPFDLPIEIIFHCCTTPLCNKINLFKRSFQGCCLSASMMLLFCSLVSFLFCRTKSSFRSDDCWNSRMFWVWFFGQPLCHPAFNSKNHFLKTLLCWNYGALFRALSLKTFFQFLLSFP